MKFFKGFLGALLTVIAVLFIENILLNPHKTSSSEMFNYVVKDFFKELPALIVFGGFYYIMPGCLLGELLYRKYIKSKPFLTGLILFVFLGVGYGTLFTGFDLSESLIFLYTITGSIVFYLVRRDYKK
ncbi:hypothetical protein AM500_03225 [Bacillus sp. FJAT-18017]|uniref:hypothetical protein n=1 Tax=Bacillus sp. FJAT-18017 TaxID=1705566 RepID=UPI0006B04936|nr:hypothetical protein [Bacillus sp. FJAT-18017]ALC88921.1 hypothetical protein AM500_03225 [Bacillus sp. FJAT-18017]